MKIRKTSVKMSKDLFFFALFWNLAEFGSRNWLHDARRHDIIVDKSMFPKGQCCVFPTVVCVGVYLNLDIFYCLSSNPQQVLVNELPKVLASKCAKKSNCGIKTALPKLMYWNYCWPLLLVRMTGLFNWSKISADYVLTCI